MKKLMMVIAIALACQFASAVMVTNTVTNVVYETVVRYDQYPVTNGYKIAYSGSLITNWVIDNVMNDWVSNKWITVTNKHYEIVGGSTTSRVYDVVLKNRPYYYPKAITNIVTTIKDGTN